VDPTRRRSEPKASGSGLAAAAAAAAAPIGGARGVGVLACTSAQRASFRSMVVVSVLKLAVGAPKQR